MVFSIREPGSGSFHAWSEEHALGVPALLDFSPRPGHKRVLGVFGNPSFCGSLVRPKLEERRFGAAFSKCICPHFFAPKKTNGSVKKMSYLSSGIRLSSGSRLG